MTASSRRRVADFARDLDAHTELINREIRRLCRRPGTHDRRRELALVRNVLETNQRYARTSAEGAWAEGDQRRRKAASRATFRAEKAYARYLGMDGVERHGGLSEPQREHIRRAAEDVAEGLL